MASSMPTKSSSNRLLTRQLLQIGLGPNQGPPRQLETQILDRALGLKHAVPSEVGLQEIASCDGERVPLHMREPIGAEVLDLEGAGCGEAYQ
eukprot:3193735-Pyramimonas_sp.AAC.1